MDLIVCDYIPDKEMRLYGFCDWHIGSPDCDEQLLERDINIVANDPQARVIIVGDILQYDTKKSKGDVYYQKYPPSQQKKRVKDLLKPIADKVLVMIGGNHDEQRTEEDAQPIEDIAESLGIRYGRGEALLKISIGEKKNKKPCVYTMYITHGWTSSRFIGGKSLNLDRLKDIVLADIYGMGHTHSQHIHKDVYCVPDLYNNNVIERTRYFINFGSYQKRGQYPIRKGMPGQCLGTPLIKLSGTEKKVQVEI